MPFYLARNFWPTRRLMVQHGHRLLFSSLCSLAKVQVRLTRASFQRCRAFLRSRNRLASSAASRLRPTFSLELTAPTSSSWIRTRLKALSYLTAKGISHRKLSAARACIPFRFRESTLHSAWASFASLALISSTSSIRSWSDTGFRSAWSLPLEPLCLVALGQEINRSIAPAHILCVCDESPFAVSGLSLDDFAFDDEDLEDHEEFVAVSLSGSHVDPTGHKGTTGNLADSFEDIGHPVAADAAAHSPADQLVSLHHHPHQAAEGLQMFASFEEVTLGQVTQEIEQTRREPEQLQKRGDWTEVEDGFVVI
eukprot:m.773958 g.773958  ORF g.773958 m.773958 type:complete len:310 (+) comp59100_c0_seq30:515-1444(+)